MGRKENVVFVKNKVRITIDGKSFTLMGNESEEHMQSVAAYIDQKMREIRQTSQSVSLDSSLAYVLTSINVADDYFKEVERSLSLEAELDELKLQCMTMKNTISELEEKLEHAREAHEADQTAVEKEPQESGNGGRYKNRKR
ncbi:cell division protein ZapA [Anaerotignum lactatifermentans]|nr:cell division protein ZapA [Anaerotignum lactatifermentans]MBM6828209.1 cell division protein ZapA [Anaerotignum lactatifermentans]